MPFYHVRIRYSLRRYAKLLIGDVAAYHDFYDLSEADIRKIRESQKKNIKFELCKTHLVPDRILAINVYKTEKSIEELSTSYDRQTRLVKRNILDGKLGQNVTRLFFPPSPLHEDKPLTIDDLLDSVQPLGLDNNWFTATCTLQLQEVAVTLFSDKHAINLDKKDVERILKRPIKELYFSDRYEAFSKELKRRFDVDMPEMLIDMRNVRREVLHKGKNPTLEEVNSILAFTIGLLTKLGSIRSD